MRGFRSDKNLSGHSLKIQSLAPDKKTRSFSSAAIQNSKQCNSDHSQYSEAGERNVQVFACAAKEDNESTETLSEEGERNEATDNCNQCKGNATQLENIDIIYPKVIAGPGGDMISKAAETSKQDVSKKRWLFADFNERFAQRKKAIEERKRMQQEKESGRLVEGIVEKHPNLIPRSRKTCAKSAFFFMKTEEAAVSPVEDHNVLFN